MKFPIKLSKLIKLILLQPKTAFLQKLLSLIFLCIPFYSLANLCLHPLEMAALLHSKKKDTSLEARLKKAEEKEKDIEEKIADLKNKDIRDQKNLLANSLNDDENIYKNEEEFSTTNMADLIYAYISKPYNKLEDAYDVDDDTYKAIPKKTRQSSRKYFKGGGYINAELFCKDFAYKEAEHRDNCLTALERLEKLKEYHSDLKEALAEAEQNTRDLKDEQWEKTLNDEDEDTEARAECTVCDALGEIRALNKPTAMQIAGNLFSIIGGGALAYLGYQSGKREGRRIDDLRIWQGYDPQGHSHISWANASAAFPLISNGIYGLTGGNSNYGNWACNPSYASASSMYSPFAHYNMTTQGMHWQNQWASPWANPSAALSFNAGPPWANPSAALSFNAGPPWANPSSAFQFNAGPPWANPSAAFQFNAGPPWANPSAALSFNAGPPWANPSAALSFNAGPPWANPSAALSFNAGSPWASPWGNAHTLQNQQMQMQFQFQQQQMQQRLQWQQTWMQNLQAIQKEEMHKQQIIGTLKQEILNIWGQIEMVKYGGLNSSAFGATTSSLFTGTPSSSGGGPQHNPQNTGPSNSGEDFSIRIR